MDRPLELRQGADVARRHLEDHVLLEALRRDDVPEEVDDLLALGRHLHLHDRVVEEVAPVLERGGAQVVRRPEGEDLHRDEPRPGVDEHPRHVREVGHGHPVEAPSRRVVQRLVEGVLADADRRPAEVVLADVDRVERGVPRLAPADQDLAGGDGVVRQLELGHVRLARDDVLHEPVPGALRVGREEDVVVVPAIFPKTETIAASFPLPM